MDQLIDVKPQKPENLVYPKEKFENWYAEFKGKQVSAIISNPEWDKVFSRYYKFHPYELDIPIGETTHQQNEFDAETQLTEIVKCAQSFEYFCHRYVKILHPKHGTIPFVLYTYQRQVIHEYENNRFNMISKFRQGGLTTIAVLWGLWKCMFQTDQQIYVLSRTDREAKAAGDIVQKAMAHFPYWMYDKDQAHLTVHERRFHDTGSKICFYTPEAARGKSATLIIIDEAAFIDNMHEEWKAMYPVIATGGNISVVSTVNGLGNWYEETYHEALAGNNFFNIIQLDYWQHPDYANPKWARETKKNLGEKAWKQEVLRDFLGSGETYISTHIIGQLNRWTIDREPERIAFQKWTNVSSHKLNWWDGALWIFNEPADGHEYIIGVDCAEGVGEDGDNSCFQVIDGGTLEQVAEFYSNEVPPHIFAQIINQIGIYYNTAVVVVENMNVGGAVLSNLQNDLAYENLYWEQKTTRTSKPGVKVGPNNRGILLEAVQHRLVNGQVRINSRRFVHELKTFIFSPQKKRPEAIKGKHDDAIMAMALALFIRDERMRGVPVGAEVPKEITEVFSSNVYEEIKQEIMAGSELDWLGDQTETDPLLAPSREEMVVNSFRVKRRFHKLISEFGW